MTCSALSIGGPSTIADALRSVDCMASEATATAFGRLFGSEGALTVTLTMALTLYIALFAIGLLTGRGSLSLSALTPRMMGLGLALTFATSWMAYSQVIWTLLAAGPDWIAATLLGIKGSASQAFAARLDLLFAAVAEAAEQARQAAGDAKGTSPADILTYAALLLLLGTVGVLVTSRIALAALLAVGPLFLILALFPGTRGLFEGWIRTTVALALVPLFTVLIGAGAVAMLDPVVAGLAGGAIDFAQATTVFVAAAIHCALMALSLKLVGRLTDGWRLPFAVLPHNPETGSVQRAGIRIPFPSDPIVERTDTPARVVDDRVRAVVAATSATVPDDAPVAQGRVIRLPGTMIHTTGSTLPGTVITAQSRAKEIGGGIRRSNKESLP